MEQKGGKLTDTVTDEMIDSSTSVLQSYMGRGTKGLQQFFSPPEVAQFVCDVFNTSQYRQVAVLDLTAGNGSLIQYFEHKFGIEIDPDQTANCTYNAITGDVQKVYPLLKRIGFTIDSIAINPPFGLTWQDDSFSSGKINSTVLTYLYALQLLSHNGQGVLIAGKDRFIREILSRPEGKHFYAYVHVSNLFENADIESTIGMFTKVQVEDSLELISTKEDLQNVVLDIENKKHSLDTYIANYTDEYTISQLTNQWSTVQSEYISRYSSKTEEIKSNVVIDKKIKISLSSYQKLVLANQKHLRYLQSLNNQSANYFALNTKAWTDVLELEQQEFITIDSKTKETVQSIIKQTNKELCPMYPVKPQQRLGFLTDINTIKCIQKDTDRNYEVDKTYQVSVRTRILEEKYTESKLNKKDEVIEKNKVKEKKLLEIKIDDHEFSETKEDIEYIIKHFDLPDPKDVAARYPDEFNDYVQLLDRIESNYSFELKPFQKDDIARLLFKGGGLLSWEQGLGKTLGGMIFTEACVQLGAEDKALFIVPQDIIPQWHRELNKFFPDKTLTVISNITEARQVKVHLDNGGTGWYISYYEAVSRNGRQFELLPFDEFTISNPNAGKEHYDRETSTWIQQPAILTLKSTEFCPNCTEQAQHGNWYPKQGICKSCNYSHIKLKVKPAYTHLSSCFKNGIVIVDEGTKIKGQDTLTSKAVRAIKARYRLLLTGTPIKNYIPDAFWLLWWSLGNNSPRFPFDYHGGPMKFTNEFAVVEYGLDEHGRKDGRPKVLPEVSNLSILWRLLCSSIIRRRKEETDEPLVDRIFKPVTVPFGTNQKELYSKWLKGFANYFISANPTKPISQYRNLVERYSAILGQLWKLQFATVLPEAEPTKYYSVDDTSNWTPANIKVLELAYEHAQQGDKILIGSDLVAYGPWVCKQLEHKGVLAVHITDNNGSTKSPKQRASIIQDFKENGASVLCATTHSMKLGHNLDVASVVIIKGLPWDHETFDQFIARVHRLTSKKDVTIYVVLTEGSLDQRKWELLNNKAAASQLSLDGKLFEQQTEHINLQQILNEMIKKGVQVDKTIPESQLQTNWINDIIYSEPVVTTEDNSIIVGKLNELYNTHFTAKRKKLKLNTDQMTLFEL